VAAAELRAVDYASVAIVSLAWPASAWRDAPALSGFLVPAVDGRAVKAATFSSQKWAHLRGDVVVVRCSLGRYGETRELHRADEELVAVALADLRDATGLAAPPIDTRVTRWGGGLPQYLPGHRDRVARIRRDVAAHPGLAVCGAAYDGVGIPACIRSAEAAVDVLLPHLDGGGTIEP
jgi:oxygen-dependent protoporphyrinogen oxidase